MRSQKLTVDWSIALLLALVTLVLARATPQLQIDDAYITYRYAYNLLEHGQLVWNPGQFVEGQTNLLWSLLLAGVAFLSNSTIPGASQAVCLLLGCTTAILLYFLARNLGLNRALAALLSLAFQLTPAALGFYLAGLEGVLVAALTAGALLACVKRAPTFAALLAGLLFMTRPDAAVVAVGLATIELASHRSLPQLLRNWWPALLLAVATEVFRVVYYHALVPNSIIAKSLPLSLVIGDAWKYHTRAYLLAFLAWPAAWLFITGALLGLVATYRSQGSLVVRQLGWMGAIVLAATLLMVVRNGGDWMEHFRLISQYYPAYAAGLCVFLARFAPRQLFLRFTTGTLICVTALMLFLQAAWPSLSFRDAAVAQKEIRIDPFYLSLPNRLAGLDLSRLTLSSEAAGYPQFALPGIKGHDPLGLLDPWLARNGHPAITYGRFDLNYTFFQVQPDIAIFHWAGHLASVSDKSGLLEHYEVRCFDSCDSLTESKVVMLRKTLPIDLRTRFADIPMWQLGAQFAEAH